MTPIQSKLSVFIKIKSSHCFYFTSWLSLLLAASLSYVSQHSVISPGEVFGSFEIYRPVDQIEGQEGQGEEESEERDVRVSVLTDPLTVLPCETVNFRHGVETHTRLSSFFLPLFSTRKCQFWSLVNCKDCCSLPVLLVSHETVSELLEKWHFLLCLSLSYANTRFEAVEWRITLFKAGATADN